MSVRETPYGSVEDLYIGPELRAWRIHKDAEELEPTAQVCTRDDLLYVVEGTLRLELDGDEPLDVHTGKLHVIPAGTRYRGYRWPRDGGPCTFRAVAAADAEFHTVAASGRYADGRPANTSRRLAGVASVRDCRR